eukprot:gene10392-11308_t
MNINKAVDCLSPLKLEENSDLEAECRKLGVISNFDLLSTFPDIVSSDEKVLTEFSRLLVRELTRVGYNDFETLRTALTEEGRKDFDFWHKRQSSNEISDFNKGILILTQISARVKSSGLDLPSLWTHVVNLTLRRGTLSPLLESRNFDFTHPFKATSKLDPLEMLELKIIHSLEEYRQKTVYAPVLSLCQSTGIGKTRLAFEMCDTIQFKTYRYLISYFCCRSPNSTGQPRRTTKFIDSFARLKTILQWSAMLFSIVATEFLFNFSKDEFELALNKGDFKERVLSHTIDIAMQEKSFTQVLSLYDVVYLKLASVVNEAAISPEYAEQEVGLAMKKIYGILQECTETFTVSEWLVNFKAKLKEVDLNTFFLPDHPATIFTQFNCVLLVVFDEGSNLFLENGRVNECFLSFRRATRAHPQSFVPLLTMHLDTNFKVSELSPTTSFDSSARVRMDSSYNLIHPFYTFPLIVKETLPEDLKKAEYFLTIFNLGIEDIPDIQIIYNPFPLGFQSRPLFRVPTERILEGTYSHPSQFSQQFSKGPLVLAAEKLIHGNIQLIRHPVGIFGHVNPLDENTIKLYVLAACRFDLTSTTPIIQEIILRQHLGMLMGVSKDRSNTIVTFPSEPIVSAAAQLISLIDGMMILSFGGKQEVGELLSCVIITRIFDLASYRMTMRKSITDRLPLLPLNDVTKHFEHCYTRALPVVLFIKELFPNNYEQIFQDMRHPTTPHPVPYKREFFLSIMQFNHFVKVQYKLEKSDLINCLQRSAAIVNKSGEVGIDIVIPIAVPININQTIDIYNPDTYHISALMIQAKHWEDNFNLIDLGKAIQRSTIAKEIGFFGENIPDQLYLVMNIGNGRSTGQFKDRSHGMVKTSQGNNRPREYRDTIVLQFCGVGRDLCYDLPAFTDEEKDCLTVLARHNDQFVYLEDDLKDLKKELHVENAVRTISPLVYKN